MFLVCAAGGLPLHGATEPPTASQPVTDNQELERVTIPENAVAKKWKNLLLEPLGERVTYYVGETIVAEKTWYRNGKLSEFWIKRDGKLHGVHRMYHENGKRFAEIPYRNGLVDGAARFWDDNEKLLAESMLVSGTGTLRTYFDGVHGMFDRETPYVSGRENGWMRAFGRFEGCVGRGVSVTLFDDGEINGWEYIYDEDGTFLGSGYSKRGKGHGASLRFGHDGKPLKGWPKYYLDGKRVSEEVFRQAAATDDLLTETLHPVPKPPRGLVPAKSKADDKAPVGESK